MRVCREEHDLSKLRDEARATVTACVGDRSCASVGAGDAMRSCLEDLANAPLDASAAAVSFCDDAVAALEECWSTMERAACVDGAKSYADSTIAAARRCLETSCSRRATCIADAFAVIDIP